MNTLEPGQVVTHVTVKLSTNFRQTQNLIAISPVSCCDIIQSVSMLNILILFQHRAGRVFVIVLSLSLSMFLPCCGVSFLPVKVTLLVQPTKFQIRTNQSVKKCQCSRCFVFFRFSFHCFVQHKLKMNT